MFRYISSAARTPSADRPGAARRAAALRPHIKVLFMSGYTDDAMVRRQVSEDIFAFIRKPFAPAVLEAKVREVLDSAEPYTQAFTASDRSDSRH